MADLDTLRPEVREAIRDLAIAARLRPEYQQPVGIIRAELLRLATIETDALIALDCEHDWQVEHKRAEKAEAELAEALKANRDCVDHFEQMQAELAALKARIAEAPMAVVQSAPGAIKASFHGYGCFEYTAENLQPKLRGKRVRLVVEE